MKQKKTASILRKFLFFNFITFSVLGIFTFLYLKAIQPNLVKTRSSSHLAIINNTSDHIERLNIQINKEGIKQFLLSTRFLFQSLDRVQFFNINGELIGDTNILDLDQSVFSKTDLIIEENIDGSKIKKNIIDKSLSNKDEENKKSIKEAILNKYLDEPLVLENKINESFFISTLKEIKINNMKAGYIIVTEEANDILFAVKERKNFIIRTVLAVALVILIFSLFLNTYILKPIKFLVRAYTSREIGGSATCSSSEPVLRGKSTCRAFA